MILLSNPYNFQNEIELVSIFFELGLCRFHLRKPFFSQMDSYFYLKSIPEKYHSKIVIHQHYDQLKNFNLKGVHLSESQRINLHINELNYKWLSTSAHTIKDFNQLSEDFKSAFIGPIFPSISKKDYSTSTNWNNHLKQRTNAKTQLVALGGIEPNKLESLKTLNIDNYAVLGFIWHSTNPLERFQQLKSMEDNLVLFQQFDVKPKSYKFF